MTGPAKSSIGYPLLSPPESLRAILWAESGETPKHLRFSWVFYGDALQKSTPGEETGIGGKENGGGQGGERRKNVYLSEVFDRSAIGPQFLKYLVFVPLLEYMKQVRYTDWALYGARIRQKGGIFGSRPPSVRVEELLAYTREMKEKKPGFIREYPWVAGVGGNGDTYGTDHPPPTAVPKIGSLAYADAEEDKKNKKSNNKLKKLISLITEARGVGYMDLSMYDAFVNFGYPHGIFEDVPIDQKKWGFGLGSCGHMVSLGYSQNMLLCTHPELRLFFPPQPTSKAYPKINVYYDD